MEDASGFKVGMGIQIHDRLTAGNYLTSTAVITAIEGNTLYFDQPLVYDYSVHEGGVVSNASSILYGVDVQR
ncbi:hypothetical protein [Paenibacillus koleovorans]|uniref:hypothetical protein n=1 Tax=Paenibacillus koleovorans TaxID=121608 RepID=UPI000FDA0EEA|nr:hypothetical protein [Paenibacillus koleovorans]